MQVYSHLLGPLPLLHRQLLVHLFLLLQQPPLLLGLLVLLRLHILLALVQQFSLIVLLIVDLLLQGRLLFTHLGVQDGLDLTLASLHILLLLPQ